MRLRRINPEVYFSGEDFIGLSRRDIVSLKKAALKNKRRRARLCAHKSIKDRLHEMFVVHARGAYVRPHKHLNKSESLHVIEGKADLFIFDRKGKINKIIKLGEYGSGRNFYYRISRPLYHSLLIRSKFFVFHEAINGPFRKFDNIPAPWSPDEQDYTGIREYITRIIREKRSR